MGRRPPSRPLGCAPGLRIIDISLKDSNASEQDESAECIGAIGNTSIPSSCRDFRLQRWAKRRLSRLYDPDKIKFKKLILREEWRLE